MTERPEDPPRGLPALRFMRLPSWLWRRAWSLRTGGGSGGPASGRLPDFALMDTRGGRHSLYNAAPRALTMVWFTNLCGDCLSRRDLLGEVVREAGARIRVLAVSLLPVDDPLALEAGRSAPFPILLDPDDVVTTRLGLAHPPATCPLRNLYIVDGAGEVRFRHHLSAVDPDEFRAAWRSLAGPPSAG